MNSFKFQAAIIIIIISIAIIIIGNALWRCADKLKQ